MKQFFSNIGKAEFRNILALICVLGVFVLVIILIFRPIPEQNNEMVYMIVGQILALGLGGATAYYFGSSKNQAHTDANKNDSDQHA